MSYPIFQNLIYRSATGPRRNSQLRECKIKPPRHQLRCRGGMKQLEEAASVSRESGQGSEQRDAACNVLLPEVLADFRSDSY